MPDDANAERQNLVRDAYMQAAREARNPWSAVVAALDAHDAKLARTPQLAATDDQIKHMVDRFLRWRLPAEVTEEMVCAASKVFHEQDAEHGWMRRAIEAALAAARQEPEPHDDLREIMHSWYEWVTCNIHSENWDGLFVCAEWFNFCDALGVEMKGPKDAERSSPVAYDEALVCSAADPTSDDLMGDMLDPKLRRVQESTVSRAADRKIAEAARDCQHDPNASTRWRTLARTIAERFGDGA